NGFALSSPRSSAWTENGSGSRRSNSRKRTCMASLRLVEETVRSAYSLLGDQRKRIRKVTGVLSQFGTTHLFWFIGTIFRVALQVLHLQRSVLQHARDGDDQLLAWENVA